MEHIILKNKGSLNLYSSTHFGKLYNISIKYNKYTHKVFMLFPKKLLVAHIKTLKIQEC